MEGKSYSSLTQEAKDNNVNVRLKHERRLREDGEIFPLS